MMIFFSFVILNCLMVASWILLTYITLEYFLNKFPNRFVAIICILLSVVSGLLLSYVLLENLKNWI